MHIYSQLLDSKYIAIMRSMQTAKKSHKWYVCFIYQLTCFLGFPGGKEVKSPPANAGLIPGLGRSPGGGNGNSLQYSC